MQWTDPVYLGRLIEGLPHWDFVGLGNALLSETAAVNRIDRSCVATNLHIDEPDGGIDARCRNSPEIAGRLIPRPNVDYQFKGGEREKSVAKIVEEDIVGKPRVVEGLRDGHAFVYVAGWDRGDAMDTLLAAELRQRGVQVEDEQVVFLGKDTVARLLAPFPGIVARFLKIDVPLLALEAWSAFPALGNEFQADAAVEARLRDLRARIGMPRSITRVVGAPGDGKTRTVLEALRGSALAPSVLYAAQVAAVTPSFVAHLRRTAGIQCTLVVDEVDDAAAEQLTNRFSSMPDGVRLVMIGLDASGRAQGNTLQVEGLSEDVLVAAIRAIVRGLPEETARLIARDCERSPKLAVLIAGRIRDDPSLVGSQRILADGQVWSTLDRYLDLSEGKPAWQAISATALLTRLGWTDAAERESEVLFKAVGIFSTDARRYVDRLHERFGIAPVAGRFRYVSPAILADYLAARQLGAWTRARLIDVLNALTPEMAESFARRVRRMSAVLRNRAVVEEVILGDQGPFRSLAELETSQIGAFLRLLAAPFPGATLGAFRRIIAPASLDELRAATRSRRDLVWALEELLWPEETFEDAAGLLLRLALAENETWANNATATWVETFQTMLGRTAAGWERRSRVLRRAATSPDPTARQLAARAIGAALRMGRLSRLGMPPVDVAGMPSQEWRPPTYAEWAEAIVAYLRILAPLLADAEAGVRRAAAEALGEGAGAAVSVPRVLGPWVETARTLAGADYELRAPVVKALDQVRARLENELKDADVKADAKGDDGGQADGADRTRLAEVQERLAPLTAVTAELRGQDFSSRLRRTLSLSPWDVADAPSREEADKEIMTQLEALAEEAVRQPPLLQTEWAWLLEGEPWRVARWGEVLGRMDRDRVFEPDLRRLAAEAATATMWMSLYDLAYAKAIDDPDFIDRRVAELSLGDAPVGQVFDLLWRAGYSPARFSAMLTLFNEAAIAVEAINQLAYSPWGAALPAAEALQLAEAALARADDLSVVVPFVSNYLEQVKDAAPLFRNLAQSLLFAPPRGRSAASAADDWIWATLALLYVDEMPVPIASAALKHFAARGPAQVSRIQEVLQRAWMSGDRRRLFTEAFAAWLTSGGPSVWYVREALSSLPLPDLGRWPGRSGIRWSQTASLLAVNPPAAGDWRLATDLGVGFLTEWAAADPKQRVYALVDVIGSPTERPSDLHAALLDQFGEYGATSALTSAFVSGSFWGSEAKWYRDKLDRARRWTDDDRPAVRDWARQLVRYLEREVELAEARDAEDRFL